MEDERLELEVGIRGWYQRLEFENGSCTSKFSPIWANVSFTILT